MTRRHLVALVVALALVGCSGNPPPGDPAEAAALVCALAGGEWVDGRCIMPEPPLDPCDECNPEQQCVAGVCRDPEPPPWECPLPMPGCHETGQLCSSPGAPCWYNPTADPEACMAAPDCDTPPPPPTSGCVDESKLVVVLGPRPVFHSEVKAATSALGDLTGLNPNDNLDTLAAQLRTQLPNRCILSGIEALFILRDDGLYEENHAVSFEDGSWTNNGRGKFKFCHRNTGATPPPQACAPTLPGTRRRMLLHCPGDDPRRKWCDHTPSDGDLTRCQAIGLGCMPGTGPAAGKPCRDRHDCPPQTEGHPLRQACESEFYGWPEGDADPTWSSDGRIVMRTRPDGTVNRSMAFTPNGTWIKVCARDGTCGKVSR